MRINLFEFEDFKWFPGTIRESMTDYLRFFLDGANFYKPVTPLIIEGLKRTGSKQIIDLCSGGGGPMEKISKNLKEEYPEDFKIILTDKFPNINAFQFLSDQTNNTISYVSESVDATAVPLHLQGFRTTFSAIHHFGEESVKKILKNSVESGQGIGIFDGGDKNIFTIIGMIIGHPIIFFFCTPFFKPFRWSRIIFTYLIPIIPICTVWDGIASILRLYHPEELLKMAREVDTENKFEWKCGKVRNKWGIRAAYLVGYPLTVNSE